MPSARGALALGAFALSLLIAAEPAGSASSTVIGTVVKQSAPVSIDTCTATLDGDVYTPQIALHPDARVVVEQSFALEFLDANGKTSGRAIVTPPFAPAIADGGAFSAMRCEISALRLDDGSSFSNAPPPRDSHAFVNAFIGVGILAAIAFVASRNNNSGPAPADTSGASATTTPTPTPTSTSIGGGATATPLPTGSPSAVSTSKLLVTTPRAATAPVASAEARPAFHRATHPTGSP